MNPQFAEFTSFVGRQAEIAELCQFLAESRLVTVLGSGGVGKTRVAMRAALEAGGQFPDGVYCADLSGLADPGLLPNTVAAALGMMRQEARPRLEAVIDHVRGRRLLLVLDTCEHLIEECALLAEAVLQEAAGVTILTTSRQPLDAIGERVFTLSPLPVPGLGDRPGTSTSTSTGTGPGTGAGGDATELFAQRAADADQRFALTDANWPDVVRVCRRLDGIPLAIELAAVRIRALSVRELAAQLDERFDALATRHGGAPRHQTLSAAIEWSHDLCTEAERTLWARLSVFAGSFDIPAAREVCAGGAVPAEQIIATLIGLVDKSLVTRDRDRYRMLDTIREFGAAKLAGSGQEAEVKARHTARYLAMARSFDTHFLDHDQPERLRVLRAEHDNLRAGIAHGLASDSERMVRDGAALASALYGYWMALGLMREGRHWLGLALEKLPSRPSPERAWVLITRAWLGPSAGEAASAVTEATDGVAMARELRDEGLLLARGCLFRQFALMFTGQLEEAAAAGDEARRRLEGLEDRVGLLILEGQVAHLRNLSGDLPGALQCCTRGLEMLREGSATGEIGEQWLQGFLYLNAGLASYFQGGNEEAGQCYSRALSIGIGLDDILACGYALEGLGWLAAAAQRWIRAAWLLGGADTRWKQLGSRLGDNPLLEEFHRQMVEAVRTGLGEERYSVQFAIGAGKPLPQITERAITDAEELSLPAGPRS